LEIGKTIETSSQAEETWIAAAQRDPAQFRPLYERYFKPIFLFVLHRVSDKDTASDITAQTFLKALNRIHQFQPRGLPFSAWLYRIALNECTDYYRRQKKVRTVCMDEEHFADLYAEMFPETREEELRNLLPVVLNKLEPGEMQLIELRFFEALPFRDIAMILGISEVYAKVRTYRILDKMKRIFQQRV